MRIKVTQVSRKIGQLLELDDAESPKYLKKYFSDGKILFQNLGDTDIYMEQNNEASIESGIRVRAKGGTLSMSFHNLNVVNLISDGATNEDFRFMITKD